MARKTDDLDQHIGLKLRMLRIKNNITQKDLAQKLDITFQQIQKYEKAVNRISASRLYDIALKMDVDIHYFFEGYQREVSVQDNAKEVQEYFNSLKDKKILSNNDIILKLLALPSGKEKQEMFDAIEAQLEEVEGMLKSVG